jgi:cytochrome c553
MFKKLVLIGLASVLPAVATAQGSGDAARGKVSMCIGCHGIPEYKASFPSVYRVPMIAGQNPKYLENALLAYRKGERSHPTMRGIAGSLSDKDIADLAAYYGAAK